MQGTRIVLIRHGESAAQVGGYLGGHTGCQGLSPRGRRQVEALRVRLAATGELAGASQLYSSVLPRAIETAEIIAPALGLGTVNQHCDLCEQHPGETDGLTWAEFDALVPKDTTWHPELRITPDYETWAEMADRVARGLDRLAADHPGELVVVACHGGVIVHAMLRRLALGVSPVEGRAWLNPTNASMTEFAYEREPFGPKASSWELRRYNDAGHLANLAPEDR